MILLARLGAARPYGRAAPRLHRLYEKNHKARNKPNKAQQQSRDNNNKCVLLAVMFLLIFIVRRSVTITCLYFKPNAFHCNSQILSSSIRFCIRISILCVKESLVDDLVLGLATIFTDFGGVLVGCSGKHFMGHHLPATRILHKGMLSFYVS